MTIPRIASVLAALAPPFNGILDASGCSTYSLPLCQVPDSFGLTMYAVTVEHLGRAVLRASPPLQVAL